jgi:hypothetical protein
VQSNPFAGECVAERQYALRHLPVCSKILFITNTGQVSCLMLSGYTVFFAGR